MKEVVKHRRHCAGSAAAPRDTITKTSICTYFGQRVQAVFWVVEEYGGALEPFERLMRLKSLANILEGVLEARSRK
eukprot:11937623-Heterocapsa_arctica.AAC.1